MRIGILLTSCFILALANAQPHDVEIKEVKSPADLKQMFNLYSSKFDATKVSGEEVFSKKNSKIKDRDGFCNIARIFVVNLKNLEPLHKVCDAGFKLFQTDPAITSIPAKNQWKLWRYDEILYNRRGKGATSRFTEFATRYNDFCGHQNNNSNVDQVKKALKRVTEAMAEKWVYAP